LVSLEAKVPLGSSDQQDSLDRGATQDLQDLKVKVARQVTLVSRALPALLDHKVILVSLAPLVSLDHVVTLVSLDLLEQMARQVLPGLLAHLDLMVLRVQAVSQDLQVI
jgi:hypothetical protein